MIGVSYDDDLKRARTLIEEVLEREDRVLKDPAPIVLVLELGESSVDFAVRPWVRTDDYWSVRGDLLEGIKKALEANGLSIPYPQRDVRMIQEARASA